MSSLFDSIKFIAVIVLLIVTAVIMPSVRTSERHDNNAETMAIRATQEFVDTTRSKGYIDNRDYTVFTRKLDYTGLVFNVTIEYNKKRYQPLYGDPNDFYSFTDKFEVMYEGYYNEDILNILFPGNGTEQDDPSRRFNMRVGDLISVRVESMGTNVTSVLSRSTSKYPDVPIIYEDGGMIRDEAP
jgi:hypothetical protein